MDRARLISILFLTKILLIHFGALAEKSADVIINDRLNPMGKLENVLKSRGYKINEFFAPKADLAALKNSDSELLIILGGRQSSLRLEDSNFLKIEIELIKSRAKSNKKTLGICLGSQLVTVALGGKVELGNQPERGWISLQPDNPDEASAFYPFLNSGTRVFSSHKDFITALPSDAVLIATSESCKQIYTVGSHTLAVQFHPEVNAEITNTWMNEFGYHADTSLFETYNAGNDLFWASVFQWFEQNKSPS